MEQLVIRFSKKKIFYIGMIIVVLTLLGAWLINNAETIAAQHIGPIRLVGAVFSEENKAALLTALVWGAILLGPGIVNRIRNLSNARPLITISDEVTDVRFTWLNKQGVQSSDGFVLQRMHRFYYHYIEDNKILQVDMEAFVGDNDYYHQTIYTDSIHQWLPPYDNDIINERDKKRIMRNISEALTFKGIDHTFESGG